MFMYRGKTKEGFATQFCKKIRRNLPLAGPLTPTQISRGIIFEKAVDRSNKEGFSLIPLLNLPL